MLKAYLRTTIKEAKVNDKGLSLVMEGAKNPHLDYNELMTGMVNQSVEVQIFTTQMALTDPDMPRLLVRDTGICDHCGALVLECYAPAQPELIEDESPEDIEEYRQDDGEIVNEEDIADAIAEDDEPEAEIVAEMIAEHLEQTRAEEIEDFKRENITEFDPGYGKRRYRLATCEHGPEMEAMGTVVAATLHGADWVVQRWSYDLEVGGTQSLIEIRRVAR